MKDKSDLSSSRVKVLDSAIEKGNFQFLYSLLTKWDSFRYCVNLAETPQDVGYKPGFLCITL